MALQTELERIAEQHGRMVEVAIRSQEQAKAHAAVDRAFKILRERAEDCLRDTDDVRRIASDRLTTILNAAGVFTIGQLRSHSREELITIPQIRYRSAEILDQALSRYGLSLRKAEDPVDTQGEDESLKEVKEIEENQGDELLTYTQAAAIVGRSRATIAYWIKKGLIKRVSIPGMKYKRVRRSAFLKAVRQTIKKS